MSDAKDLDSRLLKDRVIFVTGPIDQLLAATVVAKMLFLIEVDRSEPLSLYVLSPGGEVNPALAIVDTMDSIDVPVHTYVVGNSASIACVIAAHGEKGKRHILPSAGLTLGACWRGRDCSVKEDVVQRLDQSIAAILAKDTGRDIQRIASDMKSERAFDAAAAVEYGLIDIILY